MNCFAVPLFIEVCDLNPFVSALKSKYKNSSMTVLYNIQTHQSTINSKIYFYYAFDLKKIDTLFFFI